MDALHSQYEAALKDWQSKYERSERDLAEVSEADNNDDIANDNNDRQGWVNTTYMTWRESWPDSGATLTPPTRLTVTTIYKVMLIM